MKNLASILKQKFNEAISRAYQGNISDKLKNPEIKQSSHEKFGHYQCNSALKIAKFLQKDPRVVAQEVIDHLDGNLDDIIMGMDIAGPGFINIRINPVFIASELKRCLKDPKLGVEMPVKKEKVIVEFSSPNIAKELHVGHLRSTIIGDTLARLLEFYGLQVIRLNHVGDFGTQFGMLIAYLKESKPEILCYGRETGLNELMQWYQESKKLFDQDSAFKKRAQEEVVKLQRGDKGSLQAWNVICDISRKAAQEIYDLLDVHLVERGESFYKAMLPDVVLDLENKGLVKISDGAKCLFFQDFKNKEGNPLPMIIQKSDGGFNYSTTDVATMKYRIEEEKASRIIVVTDIGQSLHFQMVVKACINAGYLDPEKVQFDHVTFGVVLSPDGKKFKTREGTAEKLIQLIYRSIDCAEEILQEKIPDAPKREIREMAHTLGIDALKYADLSCHRQKDYTFSYERMLKFEGNTAPYLLYSYVRILSIKRKLNKNIDSLITSAEITLKHPSETALALYLRQFGEALEAMNRELLPNRLADYLYHLAVKFHEFYRDCRVEGSEFEDSRLLICEMTSRILEKGMDILGLKTLEKM